MKFQTLAVTVDQVDYSLPERLNIQTDTIIGNQCSRSGKEVLFEMRQESDGTQRLLEFVPMLLDLKNNDSVYLIDEIDRSMHPMLSRKLLECFDLGISEEKFS